MNVVLRLIFRASLVIVALTWVPQQAASPAESDNSAVAMPEVRIRKLHLVRPDLIPYPLAIEVLC